MRSLLRVRGRASGLRSAVLGMAVAGLPLVARGVGPGLVISEWLADPAGDVDGAREYVELLATRDIDFSLNPYSVIVCNNGTGRSAGWVFGSTTTYAFCITQGSVAEGDVVYVGGSAMGDLGVKLRTRDVTAEAGDGGIGSANPTGLGVIGNDGAKADGIAVFDVAIGGVTSSTVPVDAVFFGTALGSAVAQTGGYELPVNDHYSGGKLRAGSFLAPASVMGMAQMATSGIFDTTSGTWVVQRGFQNKAATAGATSLLLLSPAAGVQDLVFAPGNLAPASYAWNRNSTNPNWLNAAQGPAVFGDGDTVRFTSAGAGVVSIDASGVSPASIVVDNNASSSYTFTGGPILGAGWIDKRGDGTLRFGLPADAAPSRNTFFGGLNIDAGAVSVDSEPAGRAAFRSNAVYVEQGASLALTSESASAELRIGELSGAGSVTLTGKNLVIHTLGDAAFSGALSLGGPTAQRGWLMVRGAATQTLTSPLAASPAWTVVGHGAGLTLGGNSALADSGARILLDGGTLMLDNREVNLSTASSAGRLAEAGSDAGVQGGGRLRFIGHASGSQESVGWVSPNQGSAIVLEVRHNSAVADTTLLISRLEQNAGGTIGFELADGNAADAYRPRILLGSFAGNYADAAPGGVTLHNGIIARKITEAQPAGSPPARGFAVVNSEDWATVDSTGGTPEVRAFSAYVPLSLAGPADNAIAQTSHVVSASTEVNSLKIAAAGAEQGVTIAEGAQLATYAVLLAGNEDYTVGGAGGFLGVGAERHLHIKGGRVLTVNAPIASDGASMIVKSGDGVLALGGTQTFAERLVLSQGVLRADPGSSLPAGATLQIRGGVLEVAGPETQTTVHLPMGDDPGQINWSTRNAPSAAVPIDTDGGRSAGSGGFAAFGGPRRIDLGAAGADNLKWEQSHFVQAGQALVFGSVNTTHPIELVDHLSLDPALAESGASYNLREIRVVDNPASANDKAVLSGRLTGGIRSDFLKMGDGVLELAADNANVSGEDGFNGGIIIGEGTLQLTHDRALGNAAHVRLGLRSGQADSALLAIPGITVAHDIHVTMGGSGVATVGGAASTAEAAAGGAVFTGTVHAENLTNLEAPAGTTVTFSGPVDVGEGVSLAKTGAGEIDVTGRLSLHTYSELSVMEGMLRTGPIDAAVVWVDSGAKLVLRDEASLSTMQWLDFAQEPDGDWAGTVDITSNRLLLPAAEMARVNGQVAQGMKDGRGIISSLTSGIMTLAVVPEMDGILVVRAYAGDFDRDGWVTAADYQRLDHSFLLGLTTPLYIDGDVDYSGFIDGDDYYRMDQAFVGQHDPMFVGAGATGAGVVPEPATLWLATMAAAGLLGRRTRNVR